MAARIVLTTTATVPNREVKEVVNIISAEVAVGMNIFKDMFSAVRDVVGGRAGSVQDTLRDLRNQALEELREEAARVGADAVVGGWTSIIPSSVEEEGPCCLLSQMALPSD